ncbi:hypothetical protein ANRL4_04084 [Anaerolineae bacterium]|nr:hypothetical protein ANRL4_04084 [Anaerolineae bacterium]
MHATLYRTLNAVVRLVVTAVIVILPVAGNYELNQLSDTRVSQLQHIVRFTTPDVDHPSSRTDKTIGIDRPFLSSAWLRVGPYAARFDLQMYLNQLVLTSAPALVKGLSRLNAIELEQIENEIGVNSQVSFVIWLIASKEGSISINHADWADALHAVDSFESRRTWGDLPINAITLDKQIAYIPERLNPASAAVLAALSRLTSAQQAQANIDDGYWALEFSTRFTQYFGDPLGSPDLIVRSATSDFLLPFSGRNLYNSGPHVTRSTQDCLLVSTAESSGIDFNAPNVLAVADGEVIAVQNENLGYSIGKSVAIRHQTSSGQIVSMYWHLSSIDSGIYPGRVVPVGTYIGQQGRGWNNAFSAHLHLELRTFNSQHDYMSINSSGTPIGWDMRSIDSYVISSIFFHGSALNYEGVAVKGTGMSRQFQNSVFPCGDGTPRTVGSIVNSSYYKNVIDNFYDHTVFANVDPAFMPGYLQSTNNLMCLLKSSSNSPLDCGQTNRSPGIPTPNNPADGYITHDGLAPTLCWQNNGDPDGDPVQFYAEVYGSAINGNSGWTNNTCWRPGNLDGHYNTYQWHVKARDNHGAESSWSSTWHFNIETPNLPPTIAFNTANGSTAGTITSRDRNWTFLGTANDPENQLNRIEFRCSGDDCGSQTGHTNGSNWSHAQNNLSGQNDVYFLAYDNVQSTASRHLDLRIDFAAPSTNVSLNNESNPANWPTWFTNAVQVRLHADDGNTGRARSGVSQIRYRLDGGSWQTQGGSDAAFTVNNDGGHTVEFYAVDNVGNVESARSVSFQIDRTPPTPPSGVVETHGVTSTQWQKVINTPSFIWSASSDGMSGVWGYQFYFGVDPNGEAYQTFLANTPRQWTPLPGGTRTGTYYLRGRTRDIAGNWSAWTSLFTFRYDGTPPENPISVAHTTGITSSVWQTVTRVADFTWPAATDEGSGLKGYYVYWGSVVTGTSSGFITLTQFQSPTPLCGLNAACTGYLRLRSVDNVDNQANEWTTNFVLRYDNAPPVADFTMNGGVTQTNQTLVNLQINASDEGSGLRSMRLSNDGQNWTAWEVYATERLWTIPAISRQSWPIYLQVRDGVGLASNVISHTLYFDVNTSQPHSTNFRMFDYLMSAGGGLHSSNVYSGSSIVGQVVDSAWLTSTSFLLKGGYQAGSQAIPLVVPGHDVFTFINGIFASGSGAASMTSTAYLMRGTVGEPGLPYNTTVISSAGYQHQPGFLAAVPQHAPTQTPTPGPTPTPEPTPACEFPRISVNNAALFSSSPNVTLNICAPRATQMLISNDGGFGGAQWESYVETKAWTLTTYGQYVLPRFVYAAFKEANGTVHAVYFDDIIYDPTAPSGTIMIGDNVPTNGVSVDSMKMIRQLQSLTFAQPIPLLTTRPNGTIDIYINGQDDNSGMADMQISVSPNFTDTTWEPFSALKPWLSTGEDGLKTMYARFRDSAGNVSVVATTTFALDTQSPLGGLYIDQRVAGPNSISSVIYLGAEDNLSGVTDMRLGDDPGLVNVPWQSYTATLTWPISLTTQSEVTLYVQYRDLAYNVSAIYSDTYLVDTAPPVMYVEVALGNTPTRTVTILAYDELSDVATMRMSNDPLMINGVNTMPYTSTITWAFDDRNVIWVQLEDSVGNLTQPYPAYAATLNSAVYLPLVVKNR